MKRFLFVLVILLIALAYAAGYFPEHRARLIAENDNAVLRTQVSEAEARVRAARLLGELLNTLEAVSAANYGQAQTLSSRFFDAVRDEAVNTPVTGLRTALQSIMESRDSVTAGLARADQTSIDTLRRLQTELRRALGYPVSASESIPSIPVAPAAAAPGSAVPGSVSPGAVPAPPVPEPGR